MKADALLPIIVKVLASRQDQELSIDRGEDRQPKRVRHWFLTVDRNPPVHFIEGH